jgi:hypothetical protein
MKTSFLAHKTPVLVIASVLWCAQAQAATDDHNAPERAATTGGRARREPPAERTRIGVIGGVGFPRPLAVEAVVKLGKLAAFGAEYGALPSIRVDGVETSLWSVAADARLFPFGGAVFIGVRAGRQHVDARTTLTMPPYGSATEELAMDSWFLNPRIGVLWTDDSGFTLGVEAGLQLPIGPTTSSSLPLSLVPGAQNAVDSVGKSVLPTVDLLRIGLLL